MQSAEDVVDEVGSAVVLHAVYVSVHGYASGGTHVFQIAVQLLE